MNFISITCAVYLLCISFVKLNADRYIQQNIFWINLFGGGFVCGMTLSSKDIRNIERLWPVLSSKEQFAILDYLEADIFRLQRKIRMLKAKSPACAKGKVIQLEKEDKTNLRSFRCARRAADTTLATNLSLTLQLKQLKNQSKIQKNEILMLKNAIHETKTESKTRMDIMDEEMQQLKTRVSSLLATTIGDLRNNSELSEDDERCVVNTMMNIEDAVVGESLDQIEHADDITIDSREDPRYIAILGIFFTRFLSCFSSCHTLSRIGTRRSC